MWLPFIHLMNSLLIIFVFNIIICCTWSICPRTVEQATQATTREKLSSGIPTKRVSNQSLRPNRLARKLILDMILLKKQTTKLLMRLRGCTGWSAPWLLQITGDRFSQSRSNCYMCHFTMNAEKIRCEIWLSWNMITQNCNLRSLFKAFAVCT